MKKSLILVQMLLFSILTVGVYTQTMLQGLKKSPVANFETEKGVVTIQVVANLDDSPSAIPIYESVNYKVDGVSYTKKTPFSITFTSGTKYIQLDLPTQNSLAYGDFVWYTYDNTRLNAPTAISFPPGSSGTHSLVVMYFAKSPSASTLSATPGQSQATVYGSCWTSGITGKYLFEYGLSPQNLSGSTTERSLSASTTTQNVSESIANLLPGNTIFYRLKVRTAEGTAYGEIKSFVTTAPDYFTIGKFLCKADQTVSLGNSRYRLSKNVQIGTIINTAPVWLTKFDENSDITINTPLQQIEENHYTEVRFSAPGSSQYLGFPKIYSTELQFEPNIGKISFSGQASVTPVFGSPIDKMQFSGYASLPEQTLWGRISFNNNFLGGLGECEASIQLGSDIVAKFKLMVRSAATVIKTIPGYDINLSVPQNGIDITATYKADKSFTLLAEGGFGSLLSLSTPTLEASLDFSPVTAAFGFEARWDLSDFSSSFRSVKLLKQSELGVSIGLKKEKAEIGLALGLKVDEGALFSVSANKLHLNASCHLYAGVDAGLSVTTQVSEATINCDIASNGDFYFESSSSSLLISAHFLVMPSSVGNSIRLEVTPAQGKIKTAGKIKYVGALPSFQCEAQAQLVLNYLNHEVKTLFSSELKMLGFGTTGEQSFIIRENSILYSGKLLSIPYHFTAFSGTVNNLAIAADVDFVKSEARGKLTIPVILGPFTLTTNSIVLLRPNNLRLSFVVTGQQFTIDLRSGNNKSTATAKISLPKSGSYLLLNDGYSLSLMKGRKDFVYNRDSSLLYKSLGWTYNTVPALNGYSISLNDSTTTKIFSTSNKNADTTRCIYLKNNSNGYSIYSFSPANALGVKIGEDADSLFMYEQIDTSYIKKSLSPALVLYPNDVDSTLLMIIKTSLVAIEGGILFRAELSKPGAYEMRLYNADGTLIDSIMNSTKLPAHAIFIPEGQYKHCSFTAKSDSDMAETVLRLSTPTNSNLYVKFNVPDTLKSGWYKLATSQFCNFNQISYREPGETQWKHLAKTISDSFYISPRDLSNSPKIYLKVNNVDNPLLADSTIVSLYKEKYQLSIKVALEGLWKGSRHLLDTICVELHRFTQPFVMVASGRTVVDSLGNAKISFEKDNGNDSLFYAVVKHRNSIETWSASPVVFREGSASYDFAGVKSASYGDNLTFKYGKWCIYSGDINQDGTVDYSDILQIDNAASQYLSGYVSPDLNGDGFCDYTDLTIVDNNSQKYVSVCWPGAAKKSPLTESPAGDNNSALAYQLFQNYPNPFNPTTKIRFCVPERAMLSLTVFNQLGEKVVELTDGVFEAGNHSVEWNAINYPSGVYVYELRANNHRESKKLIYLK